MVTYIYSLSDSTGIRYIGKSDDVEVRLKNHLKECTRKRTKKEKWLYSLKQRGEQPVLEVLDTVAVKDWSWAEVYWIAQCKAWGYNILNGTDGGEGSNGFQGKKHTEETKEKCRAANARIVNRASLSGISNGRCKLTEDTVKALKLRLHEPTKKLIEDFSVSESTIMKIKSGKRWSHILP